MFIKYKVLLIFSLFAKISSEIAKKKEIANRLNNLLFILNYIFFT